MANLCIVAIPAADDDIWQESSEKIPHMTILFLGDALSNPNVTKIVEKVKQQASYLEPFSLVVDHRGFLGSDNADVLFFEDEPEDLPWQLTEFRSSLLYDINIKSAYNSQQQFTEWDPHLTLGYPDTPAKEYKLDPGETDYVTFDRVAVWYGDYEGTEITLTANSKVNMDTPMASISDDGYYSESVENVLSHHGKKGMKWGVRSALTARSDKKFEKKASTFSTHTAVHNRAADLMDKHGDLMKLNNKPEYKKAADAGHLLNDDHPTTKKYLKEYTDLYAKRANEAAGEMTNKSGTRKYTAKPASGFFGFSVESTAASHSDLGAFNVKVKRDKKGVISGHEIHQDSMEQGILVVGEILSHHGTKGMKWGVRKSGGGGGSASKVTVTQKGKKLKTSGGKGLPAHKDAVAARTLGQKAKKSGVHSLSNQELQHYANRLNMEQNVKRLQANDKTGARRFIASILGQTGKNQAQAIANDAAKKAVAKTLLKGAAAAAV